MVLGGTKVSHKCIGPQSSQISYNFLHIKERDSISVHIRINKMTALSYLIKMGGGGGAEYQKPAIYWDQQRNLAIPFETKDHDYSWILTRVNECRGRQEIQTYQGFQRMETKLNNLHEVLADKGNSRDGSVSLKGISPITLVYILENWPFQSGQECFSDILGSQVCVGFSPFLHL